MAKSLGDSGTFGSQKTMNAIQRMQRQPMSVQEAHSAKYAPKFNATISRPAPKMPSYKKGGKVKKTGVALLHKGEVVVPKKTVKKISKTGSQMLSKAMKPFKK